MVHQRYVVMVIILGAILTGVTMHSATASLVAAADIKQARLIGAFTTSNAISVLSGAVFLVGMLRTPRVVRYIDEVVDELHKVTWPSKDETVKASTTVVFTAVFVASLVGAYDLLWNNLVGLFL